MLTVCAIIGTGLTRAATRRTTRRRLDSLTAGARTGYYVNDMPIAPVPTSSADQCPHCKNAYPLKWVEQIRVVIRRSEVDDANQVSELAARYWTEAMRP